ncbi:MAG: MBL fold metallo-hydrolase [Ignavibacteriaceae bacterium]|nr:MBL fold metallo-hydrolase [Ignavibacteriaceae bacterium]MCW8812671.1 MBL fold metallo-hydrolase [Chlorobium sp.]MCW8817122.1 MBL fold metallo-hydrolase [Ignavibacteriaceae bacterium]
MEIQFIGAAQTVTGSQHLLYINGKKILLDCGLYQGKRKKAFEINRTFKYSPSEIDVLLLSHAHIDHSGKIPGMIKNGFNGPIYTTAATVDLCQIMLRDSAHLQERDIYVVNKIRKKQHKNPFEPLYDFDDVEKAMDQFIGVQYSRPIEVAPGVMATYWDAGHILGSAGILLEINENGKKYRIGFSGDIGRSNMPIIRNPNVLRDLDLLIMESTYGNRLHAVAAEVEEEVATTVKSVVERGGKIIIPSFAVGRTQLLVYMLHKLFDQNRIPVLPIYVDSPLAVEATKIYQTHPECYDRETYRIFIQNNEDPFGFGRLTYIKNVEQSKELNDKPEPCIIISASGMAEGGRVLHHLANNIENKKNLILFVGYAAAHTLARKIIDGETEINIFGEPHKVNAEVKSMDYFSAHADQAELLNYPRLNDKNRLKNIFLVHGEEEQALPLKEKLVQKGFKNVDFPASGEKFVI